MIESERSTYWSEMSNQQSSNFHFRWAPISKSLNFERLGHNFPQMVNHLEGHSEISRKDELFRNLKQYVEGINENVFSVMPLTFHVKINQDKPI